MELNVLKLVSRNHYVSCEDKFITTNSNDNASDVIWWVKRGTKLE